jgi:hypothetical protein
VNQAVDLAKMDLSLHSKQGEALLSPATEILYGGAAGGGKSHLMRSAAVLWCSEIPGLQVYLFRRISEDLVKNHIEGPKGLRSTLAGWSQLGWVKIVEDEIRFWNGSKIYLCHCKDEKDRFKYLGAEIHVLLIDELVTFTDTIYRFLRGRVRAVGLPELPPHYKGRFPRIINGSNPGNVGHAWVKAAFIDGVEPLAIRHMPDSEGGMLRQFIPAKLDDNPSMAKDDPGYRSRLRGLGSKALVDAMESGDWNIVEGAYFAEWSHFHVIQPFTIPDHWFRMISGDWGSAKPFSFGWWAVAGEDHWTGREWIPRGAMVRHREWYGVAKDDAGMTRPNVGLKLTAEEVGKGLRDRGIECDKAVLDPACFAHNGGPSLAERMRDAGGPLFYPADNKRVPGNGAMGGWDQVRSRLKGEDFGDPMGKRPMIYCFSTCVDSIRTIPMLQHDNGRPEDLNSDMEDHAADDWRYACMGRPYSIGIPSEMRASNDSYGMQDDDDDHDWKTA